MKKNKVNEYLRYASMFFNTIKTLTDVIKKRGEDPDQLLSQFISPDKKTASEIVDVLIRNDLGCCQVVVDYRLTLADIISIGKYDQISHNVANEVLPSQKSSKTEIELRLIHFHCDVSSKEAIEELNRLGLRPATLPELLFFGAKFPDKQRRLKIIALGSRVVDKSSCGMLHGDGSTRRLSFYAYFNQWRSGYRFLAVLEPKSAKTEE